MKNIIYVLLAITLMSCKKETKLQPKEYCEEVWIVQKSYLETWDINKFTYTYVKQDTTLFNKRYHKFVNGTYYQKDYNGYKYEVRGTYTDNSLVYKHNQETTFKMGKYNDYIKLHISVGRTDSTSTTEVHFLVRK